jgi:hypothetical protein
MQPTALHTMQMHIKVQSHRSFGMARAWADLAATQYASRSNYITSHRIRLPEVSLIYFNEETPSPYHPDLKV